MTRPTDWSPLNLHKDPTPGDAIVVQGFASSYSDVADAIKSAATKLTAIANHTDGEISEYVDKLRDRAKDVSADISRAYDRYHGVAEAMTVYATPLQQSQDLADAALQNAVSAHDTSTHATYLYHYYDHELQTPGISPADTTHYTQLKQQAHQQMIEAGQSLAQAQSDLQNAISMHNTAARTAADAIKDVDSTGKLNDSGWTKFWEENGGWIGEVVDIIGKIAAVLAIIAILIPGLGEVILAIIAIVGIIAAVLTVVNAICQMTAGTKSIGQGIFEIVMAVLPFGIGRIAGKLGSAAAPAIEDAAAVTMRTSKAAQGIEGFTQSRAASEIAENLAGTKSTIADLIMGGRTVGTKIAQLHALEDMALTVKGASPRIGAMVQEAVWKFDVLPGIEPVLNITGIEHYYGELIGGESGE